MKNYHRLFPFIIAILAVMMIQVHSGYASVTYTTDKAFCFTLPAYNTGIGFTANQVFSNVTRIGDFWYFDGNEYSIQGANLNVSGFSLGIFTAYVVAINGGQYATVVTVMNPSYVTAPSAVTISSGSIYQVFTSSDFLSSAVSCWFFDTASYRVYLKVLISGNTLVTINMNPSSGSTGTGTGTGTGISASLVNVADIQVNVVSGQKISASLTVTWTFFGSVTLTSESFQGDQAYWLQGPAAPHGLSVQNNSIPLIINVPEGTVNGQYNMTVANVFSYLGGSSQSVKSQITIVVGGAAGPFSFLIDPLMNYVWNPLSNGFSFVYGYVVNHPDLDWVGFGGSGALAVVAVALVVRKR